MRWGLTQGLLATDSESLAPVTTALGPNRYLSQIDFLKMLGLALIAHLLVFGVAAMLPKEEVTNIPVRALSFKLGEVDQIAAYRPQVSQPPEATPPAAPVMQALAEARISAAALPRPAKPVKPEARPLAKPKPPPKSVAPLKPIEEILTDQSSDPSPAIAPQPQQYVREVGQAPVLPSTALLTQPVVTPQGAVGGQAHETTMTDQTSREIRERYEQQISSWIQRHKIYPGEAGGRAGRTVVRMRIDRSGIVRYYALEQSSGVQALDAAALDMIRRANPVPAVPANYPAGSLIEFLIPISFAAPQ